MAALLYFDITENLNVNTGLRFFAWCSVTYKYMFTFRNVKMDAKGQANKHHARKLSPGFTF